MTSENDPYDTSSTNDSSVNLYSSNNLVAIGGLGAAAIAAYFATSGIDFHGILESAVTRISTMGPSGYLYFSAIYILAEILAVPAFPLTASSGYLFGVVPGFLVVLASATIAAGISFLIGRTFLREVAQGWAMKLAGEKWRAIDSAVEREGFKVVLLLRLSPLLPFALSNYLYGITSVDFFQFIVATFLGFSPGTFGVVYAASAGKDIFSGVGQLPWYGYFGIGLILTFAVNTIGKFATEVITAEIEGVQNSTVIP
jgi:uncharacterized membrane protein YdjX (TVP38/TMEM64 family)